MIDCGLRIDWIVVVFFASVLAQASLLQYVSHSGFVLFIAASRGDNERKM